MYIIHNSTLTYPGVRRLLTYVLKSCGVTNKQIIEITNTSIASVRRDFKLVKRTGGQDLNMYYNYEPQEVYQYQIVRDV
jgi:hypothetical protein